jgi:hypothetical protein
MRRGRRLTSALIGVMVTQAGLGLLLPGEYRDVEWIKAAWFGNDWVTLVVAAPLLFFGFTRAGHGSVRGALIWFAVTTVFTTIVVVILLAHIQPKRFTFSDPGVTN